MTRVCVFLLGALLCLPSFAIDCTPAFVAEAATRCATETGPCTLITWQNGQSPLSCQLNAAGTALSWWVGIGTTGTVLDPSSGQLEVVYTFVPLIIAPLSPTGTGAALKP